ncbi:MAG TPA: 16S rRNA (guanine(966)-N(2))-methyltransferase RsmD [Holosporales bacterium]|nr:16S rRNA (guanine(966)-N(2))-methyltransferase RsmD [Holosporales bacterium]
MRIISGKYKGLHLLEPDRNRTRPTSDKVRQAVFNILEHAVLDGGFHELSILDAFAGSGALGLEALSRGAKKCLFVEKSAKVARVLIENIKAIVHHGDEVAVQAVCQDVTKIKINQYFDLVFLDPPFKKTDLYLNVMLNLKQQGAVDSKTVFYVESSEKLDYVLRDAGMPIREISSRQFGNVVISFWCLV